MGENSLLNWMPIQGSNWAYKVDLINNFITYVAAFCTLAITGVMIYFAIKYRRRSEDQKTLYVTHNLMLETVWTAVPTVVCIFVFIYGYIVYRDMRQPPSSAIEINVEGKRWQWNFTYPNGKTSTEELVVPLGKAVLLIMKSLDVNHSFFVPAMRVKEDLVNSQYHYLWFTPEVSGNFPIYCTEYCGAGHSSMLGTLKVVSQQQYEDFINNRTKEELPPAELGKKLFTQNCAVCHSIDGTTKIGPALNAKWGTKEELLDGTSVTVDENYVHESIVDPNKKVVKGFVSPSQMTSFANLKENEVQALIAYIKSLK